MSKNTKVWTTKDGTKVRVCDMTDDHLKNTIKYLTRRLDRDQARMSFMTGCLRGEEALYQAETALDHLMESTPGDVWPIFDDMVDEINHRGLNNL